MSPTPIPDPLYVAPRSPAEAAAALKRAADARQSLLIRGAGTKLDWERPRGRVDVVLDMRALNRVLAHEHGDMTATVEAGARLADVNRTLAEHGQWLPLDPPHAESATIGGVLATNDSGPLRHRYGTPRDLLIGVQLATVDGVLAKSGGRVVKNVAGYDLGKLIAGSFGSLAAIVSATFKLSPLPPASKTLECAVADARALGAVVRAVMTSQLEPITFDIAWRGAIAPQQSECRIRLQFASLAEVVDAQIERAAKMASAWATSAPTVADGTAERALWRNHTQTMWRHAADDAIVRASWLPADIQAVISALEDCGADDVELVGRAAIAAGHIRMGGGADSQTHVIEALRTSSAIGNVVVVRGSTRLKERVDVWGSAGDRQPIFDAIKRALDPHNVLNADRGPV